MKETYQTDHPIMKEITIGDKFVTRGGFVVTFIKYYRTSEKYIFQMVDEYDLKYSYSKDLMYDIYFENHPFDIRYRYITLKEKINQL